MSDNDLIQKAIEMRSQALAPYSNYKVGAAILTESGKIFGGCNIENSSYSLTICAERVALFKAVSEGETKFKALSVSTNNAGMPCGACRQVIWDICGNIPILICNNNKLITKTESIRLLPMPFDNTKLP
ncbi:MAG: cytidine deaminase [bacterium]|jgi:cytidine deaminase|tara:strand:+ start:58 stop:444 length:387 start_codon:yes stop_codon:yes gene_type:complete